jgi:hypothetical protein
MGDYCDSLQVLDQYSTMHDFDWTVQKSLRTQLCLEFSNHEIANEQVLKNFPSAVHHKILHKLYMPSLVKMRLMRGIWQQFVDAFLTSCCVKNFSPGKEIVEHGFTLSDFFL